MRSKEHSSKMKGLFCGCCSFTILMVWAGANVPSVSPLAELSLLISSPFMQQSIHGGCSLLPSLTSPLPGCSLGFALLSCTPLLPHLRLPVLLCPWQPHPFPLLWPMGWCCTSHGTWETPKECLVWVILVWWVSSGDFGFSILPLTVMWFLQSALTPVTISPCREHKGCPSFSFLLAGSAGRTLDHSKSGCQWVGAAWKQPAFHEQRSWSHIHVLENLSMVPSGEQTPPQAAAGSIRLVETPGGEGTICVVFMPLTQAETPIPVWIGSVCEGSW